MNISNYETGGEPECINPIAKDLHYFNCMFSKPATYMSTAIQNKMDHMDYPASFIFDEYPDRITMQKILNNITTEIGIPEDDLWLTPLIEVLLCHDIIKRRNRRYGIMENITTDEQKHTK